MKVPTEIHQLSSAALDSKDEDISDLSCLESVEFGQKEFVVKTEDFLYARVGSADWNVPRPRSKHTLQILDQSERRTIFDSDRWTDPVHSSTGTLHSLNGDVVEWKNEGFKRSQDHESGSISNSMESRIDHATSSSSKTPLDLPGLISVSDAASLPSGMDAAAATIKKPSANQTQKQLVCIHRRPILKPIRIQTQKQPMHRPCQSNAILKENVDGYHNLDVLGGRGERSNHQSGNPWYPKQVEFHKVLYRQAGHDSLDDDVSALSCLNNVEFGLPSTRPFSTMNVGAENYQQFSNAFDSLDVLSRLESLEVGLEESVVEPVDLLDASSGSADLKELRARSKNNLPMLEQSDSWTIFDRDWWVNAAQALTPTRKISTMNVPTEIYPHSSTAFAGMDDDVSDLSCLESVEVGLQESVVKTEDLLYASVGSEDLNVPPARSENNLQMLDHSDSRTMFDSDSWADPVHSLTGILNSLNGDVVGSKNEGFQHSKYPASGSISISMESRISHASCSSSSSKALLDFRTIFESDRWADPVHSLTGILHSLNGDVVGSKNEGFQHSKYPASGSISNSIEARINHESSSSSKTRLDLLGLSLVADTASPPSEVKAAATTIKKPNRNKTQKQPVYIHRRPILKPNKTPIRMQTQKQPVSRPRPRRANAARKEYVAGFHHLDVLFCPAAQSSRHPGNRWYRKQVEFHRVFYQTATTKKEKLTIVFDILIMIRARGGRILIQEESTLRWYLAHYTMAYIIVQKALQN
jgi:hypothetical protein